MKVSNATRVLSHDVSCALTYLVKKEGRDEAYLTTVWFIQSLDPWFNLMSSRSPVMGLSQHHPGKYEEATPFLQNVIEVFEGVKDWSRRRLEGCTNGGRSIHHVSPQHRRGVAQCRTRIPVGIAADSRLPGEPLLFGSSQEACANPTSVQVCIEAHKQCTISDSFPIR